MMAEKNETLDNITSGMTKYPQILINILVKDKPAMNENGPISEAIKNAELKIGNRGRILVRYSGTEPLARVMLEGDSNSIISEIATEIADVIRSELN